MEIIIKFIFIMLLESCSAEVYHWNVRSLEHSAESDTDFGNELKLQSELSNELQRDLLKISGKANKNDNTNGDNSNLGKQYNDQNKDQVKESARQEEDISKSYGMNERQNLNSVQQLGTSSAQMTNFEASTKIPDGSDKQFIQIEQNKEQFNRDNEHNINDDRESYQGANVVNDYHKNYYNSHLMDPIFSKYNLDSPQTRELNTKPTKDGHRDVYVDNNNMYLSPQNREPKPINPDNKYYSPVSQETFTSYNDPHQTKYQYTNANDQKYEDIHLNESQNHTINEDSQEDYQLPMQYQGEGSMDFRDFLGSNLFEHTAKKCFTGSDEILLTIRKDFENLMPKDFPQCLLNDRMVAVLMNYFYVCHRLISTLTLDEAKDLVLTSFFDTLGGYLNFYLVPVAKYSYYAGQLSLETTYNILRLHRQCKNYLNTNGNGWKAPMRDVLNELSDIYIEPLHLDGDQDNNEPSYCLHLEMDINHTGSEDTDKIIVPLPKLEVKDDDTGQLGNVWLPFRRKRVYDLKSQKSAYIVVKFYETVSKCYLYENVNQDGYNRIFKEWLFENIHSHLSDDVFYPGLGAVLRVSEFLRRGRTHVGNYNNLWQTDYETSEGREKKSYQINGKQKYMVMPHNFKRKQKTWTQDENFYQDNEQNQNFLKKDPKRNYKTENLDRKHRQYMSRDHLQLAEAVIEEQSNANQTTTKFRVSEMTPLQWIIIIVPVVVVLVVGVICCLKYRKRKKKSKVSLKDPGGGKRKSKKSEEETHLLNENSKSVLHGKYSYSKSNRFKPPPHMRSVSSPAAGSTGSSSSSLMCQLPAKCFAFKRSGPAIIETTSLDYSSSEAEEKSIKKSLTKSVKIDEKSGKSKGKEPATASNNGLAENGKEKKSKEIPKSNSKSSWETTYSSK